MTTTTKHEGDGGAPPVAALGEYPAPARFGGTYVPIPTQAGTAADVNIEDDGHNDGNSDDGSDRGGDGDGDGDVPSGDEGPGPGRTGPDPSRENRRRRRPPPPLLLWRSVRSVSGTRCVVSVLGSGVAGRVHGLGLDRHRRPRRCGGGGGGSGRSSSSSSGTEVGCGDGDRNNGDGGRSVSAVAYDPATGLTSVARMDMDGLGEVFEDR